MSTGRRWLGDHPGAYRLVAASNLAALASWLPLSRAPGAWRFLTVHAGVALASGIAIPAAVVLLAVVYTQNHFVAEAVSELALAVATQGMARAMLAEPAAARAS